MNDPLHPSLRDDNGVVIYSRVNGFCSACAPRWMSEGVVEIEVNRQLGFGVTSEPTAIKSVPMFRCKDVSTLRDGPSTPSPCNEYSARRHWFLMKERKELHDV